MVSSMIHSSMTLKTSEQNSARRAVLMSASSSERQLLELRVATATQLKLAPAASCSFSGLGVQQVVHPASELSGDFIDYLQLADGSVLFCVADVAGHGTHAALFTPLLKATFRSMHAETGALSLDHWLRTFASALASTQTGTHAAMCLGVVSTDRTQLRIAGAAQFPPPLLCTHNGCELLELIGKPLGLFPDAHYSESCFEFPARARLLVFSDGILDVLHGDDELRLNTLCDRVGDATGSCADVLARVGVDLNASRLDDIACLLIAREAQA